MEDDMFAGLKKKKTKKVVNADDIALPGAEEEVADAEPVPPTEPASGPKETDNVQEDDDLNDFSALKKKKKKKAVTLDLEDVATPAESNEAAAAAEEAPSAEVADDDFSDLKKKKKKKVVLDLDEPAAAAGDEAPSGDLEDFSDLKKKKKKKGKSAFDMEAFEKELAETEEAPVTAAAEGSDEEAAGDVLDEDLPEGEDPFTEGGGENKSRAELAAEKKAWLAEPNRDYEYIELLGRFYALLQISHPSLGAGGVKKRYTLAPPQMHKDGNKRSVFANVSDICKKMHRQPEHVIQFLFAELGTTGSVDGSGRLVIKGRFQQKQIENVLRRYIVEYVTCRTCKSPDTLLAKENRLYFVTCQTCGSHRSVSAIQAGFKAQVMKRKALAAKGG